MKLLMGLASIAAIIPLEAGSRGLTFFDNKNIIEISEYRESYDYFRIPNFYENWNGKIKEWQSRANNEDLDVQTAIRFVKGRYQEFQLKFLNTVNNIQVSQDASTLTAATIVDKAIKQINVDRTTIDPFTYSYMVASGDRYTSESHTITTENYTWGTQNT